jgi:hypothetical protein
MHLMSIQVHGPRSPRQLAEPVDGPSRRRVAQAARTHRLVW